MGDFKALSDAVIKGDIKTALAETQKALDAGSSVNDILNKGLIATMNEIGERFSKGPACAIADNIKNITPKNTTTLFESDDMMTS